MRWICCCLFNMHVPEKRNDRGMHEGEEGDAAVAVAMLSRTVRKPSAARMHACALLALRCKNLKREARAPVRHSIQCWLECWTPFFLQLPPESSLQFNSSMACLQMQSCLDSCPASSPHIAILLSAWKCHTFFQLLALHCTALYCILSLPPFNQIHHQSLHIY
jgi:hypothetical protein